MDTPNDIQLEEKQIDTFFRILLTIKGIDGTLEILGGFLLLFLNPARLNQFVVFLTEHELFEDPHDIVVNHLINLANTLSVNPHGFVILYLLSHGIVKLFLIVALFKNKLWAYPVSIFFFSIFIIYEGYRFFIGHSGLLLFLIILDILVTCFIYLEYKKVIKHATKAT